MEWGQRSVRVGPGEVEMPGWGRGCKYGRGGNVGLREVDLTGFGDWLEGVREEAKWFVKPGLGK